MVVGGLGLHNFACSRLVSLLGVTALGVRWEMLKEVVSSSSRLCED